jgi:hypothetical protein
LNLLPKTDNKLQKIAIYLSKTIIDTFYFAPGAIYYSPLFEGNYIKDTMTKDEYEMLRICRSAELAYFMSEHTLEKPKFIQSWFKNKVKTDRDDLSAEQIQTVCSEWQLKQKTFYKKYKGFVDHFDKVIQNLKYVADQNDSTRINSLITQLEVVGVHVMNTQDDDVEINRDDLPPLNQAGLLLIEPAEGQINADGNIEGELTLELSTVDAKRFYYILDIIRLYGFDSIERGKYVASELIAIKVNSSVGNESNTKVVTYEHGRDEDWREELAKTHKKD